MNEQKADKNFRFRIRQIITPDGYIRYRVEKKQFFMGIPFWAHYNRTIFADVGKAKRYVEKVSGYKILAVHKEENKIH